MHHMGQFLFVYCLLYYLNQKKKNRIVLFNNRTIVLLLILTFFINRLLVSYGHVNNKMDKISKYKKLNMKNIMN